MDKKYYVLEEEELYDLIKTRNALYAAESSGYDNWSGFDMIKDIYIDWANELKIDTNGLNKSELEKRIANEDMKLFQDKRILSWKSA